MTVPHQLNEHDVNTLTSVMEFISNRKPYVYLEIGSYLGGSLVWHLHNTNCKKIISVDTRSTEKIKDERNIDYAYTVSTQDMINTLTSNNVPVDRLECVDGTVTDIVSNPKADIVFIDGEHTNDAAFNDAINCLSFVNDSCIILFHDDWVVYKGIEKFYDYLSTLDKPFKKYKFKNGDITAIVIGTLVDPFDVFASPKTGSWDELIKAADARLNKERNKL